MEGGRCYPRWSIVRNREETNREASRFLYAAVKGRQLFARNFWEKKLRVCTFLIKFLDRVATTRSTRETLRNLIEVQAYRPSPFETVSPGKFVENSPQFPWPDLILSYLILSCLILSCAQRKIFNEAFDALWKGSMHWSIDRVSTLRNSFEFRKDKG